jgi:hypothetical protein
MNDTSQPSASSSVVSMPLTRNINGVIREVNYQIGSVMPPLSMYHINGITKWLTQVERLQSCPIGILTIIASYIVNYQRLYVMIGTDHIKSEYQLYMIDSSSLIDVIDQISQDMRLKQLHHEDHNDDSSGSAPHSKATTHATLRWASLSPFQSSLPALTSHNDSLFATCDMNQWRTLEVPTSSVDTIATNNSNGSSSNVSIPAPPSESSSRRWDIISKARNKTAMSMPSIRSIISLSPSNYGHEWYYYRQQVSSQPFSIIYGFDLKTHQPLPQLAWIGPAARHASFTRAAIYKDDIYCFGSGSSAVCNLVTKKWKYIKVKSGKRDWSHIVVIPDHGILLTKDFSMHSRKATPMGPKPIHLFDPPTQTYQTLTWTLPYQSNNDVFGPLGTVPLTTQFIHWFYGTLIIGATEYDLGPKGTGHTRIYMLPHHLLRDPHTHAIVLPQRITSDQWWYLGELPEVAIAVSTCTTA